MVQGWQLGGNDRAGKQVLRLIRLYVRTNERTYSPASAVLSTKGAPPFLLHIIPLRNNAIQTEMCNFAPNDKQPMNKQDWTHKKLGEVCDIYQPKTLSSNMLLPDGKYAVYGANGIIGRYDKYNHESSEVLMTCRGATCGTINVSEPFSWINGNAMVIHPQSDELNKAYLVYVLKGIDLSNVITGAAQPQITRQSLSPTKIPVPPIAEQERIVAELDLLSGIIEKKKEQLKAYDQLAQSIFYTMFGDPIDNPKGWEVKKLGEIANCTSGGTPSRRVPRFFEGTINWFSAGELNNMYLRDSIEKITQEAIDNSNAKLCPANSLFIGMYDTAAFKLGIPIKDSASNQACANVELSNDNVIWLYYSLLLMRDEALKHRHGARQKNLSLRFIKDFYVPIPPLSLQEEFAEKIEAIERQKALVQQSIDETQTMFDCTMDKYFG